MEPEILENNYTYHAPDEEKAKWHDRIRKSMKVAATGLNAMLPECREKSLALTKLEEATMWANAALARSK